MKKILIAVAVVLIAAFAAPAFAATNPFMDVPASHWAYDAVSQLASRGVISGYPDGSFKGAQPSTRYEVASMLARALAKVDMEKASKQDVEMLKKLIVEFNDELDALGVKVDQLDERVAVLEKDLGGWSFSGQLRFDAKFSSDNDVNGWYDDAYDMVGKNEFDIDRYRLFIRKRINETTNFEARLGAAGNPNNGNPGMQWERYYITTMLPFDIKFTAGKQNFDWEGELGFYTGEDAWYGDLTPNMLRFQKTWGMANFDLVLGRRNDNGAGLAHAGLEQFLVAAKVGLDFNEKVMFGLMGYMYLTDDEIGNEDHDLSTYGVYAGYKFTPSIQLKGLYYLQDLGTTVAAGLDDDPTAWKVILDVDQDLLKFTSLWVEYGQMHNNFQIGNTSYADFGADVLHNLKAANNNNTSTIIGAVANQQWNDKWRSFARYYMVDHDTNTIDDATNWGLGVGYRLNPAVEFELAYDSIDYGTGAGNARNGDDNIIRFRTFVSF